MERTEPSRAAAVRVLTRVLHEGLFLENAIALEASQDSAIHLGWVRDVCAGVLRWKSRLEAAIDFYSRKKKPRGFLQKALKIALYQVYIQNSEAAPKVIFETVEWVKKTLGAPLARFSNALLRRALSEKEIWMGDLPIEGVDPARWWCLPPWLWNTLVKEREMEWTVAFARASLARAPLWLRAKNENSLALLKDFGQAGPLPLSRKVEEPRGRVEEWPGYREGAFFVQDVSSQMVVHGVADHVVKNLEMKKPLRVLDLCAAPGGKALALALLGYEVIATDFSSQRLERLKESITRLNLPARGPGGIQLASYPGVLGASEKYDLIWVDAPCSGSGTLRRKPEVRWLRTPGQVQELLRVQEQLIETAWARLRPGGVLVYSVCSVLQDEGPRRLPSASKVWELSPQLPPHGDGFWAGLASKT